MISKLDKVMEDLEKKEAKIHAHIIEVGPENGEEARKTELVRIDEILIAIRKVSEFKNFKIKVYKFHSL